MLSSQIHKPTSRRGLAAIEMVLAIPLVLLVMALSVAVGTAACWKLRGDVVARDAAFSRRWPRHGWPDPRPVGWPHPAAIGRETGLPLVEMNFPAFANPILRGPLPGGIVVNSELFDPTDRVLIGRSHIHRRPPLLPRLIHYHLEVEMPLLDHQWQYRQVGLGSNTSRRVPHLYRFPTPDPALEAAYRQSIQAVLTTPIRPALAPLDRDEEFFAWYGHSPDFHPRARRFCGLDVEQARKDVIEPLVERIDGQPPPGKPKPKKPRGVPARMAEAFLRMYQQQLEALQNAVPPGSPAQIAELQNKIDLLQQFLDSL